MAEFERLQGVTQAPPNSNNAIVQYGAETVNGTAAMNRNNLRHGRQCFDFAGKSLHLRTLNPRPAGVWLVTRPAGGGGQRPPPEISQTTGPISKFQTPFDSHVRELPVQGQKVDLEVTDDVTGQVKVRIFDFSGLVTSASKISMLSANKANESAWIMSLT